MRLFLALRVPPLNIKSEKWTKLKANLEKGTYQARWIPEEHLYIPLAELGDHGRGSFLRMYQDLKDVSSEMQPFDLKLNGLWGYPKQDNADMLWIGVQNYKNLRLLETFVAKKLQIPEDDFIRPHLPVLHLERERNVSDIISPFKNADFGTVNIHEVLFLEKLPNKWGTHMVGSHLLHGQDLSGLGLS